MIMQALRTHESTITRYISGDVNRETETGK